MPSIRKPRSGSMQFWPRKRAKKIYARIRSWPKVKEVKPLAFIGYKVGMMHMMATNENKNSHTKGEQISVPTTIIECPPIKLFSVRFYNQHNNSLQVQKEIFFKSEKNLGKKINLPKENLKELENITADDYENITMTVYTQPQKTGFGKKKPELVEIGLGGSNQEKIAFIKQNHDKEITIESVFSQDQMVDIHAITKGQGFQGPVKRLGIGLKNHRSEKGRRAPGSLGPWVRQQHIMYRVAHAGQTGFHQRVEYNKQILQISNDLEKIPQNIHKYGNVKSNYIVIHGSVAGTKKRMVIMTVPKREKTKKHKLGI
ncbi:MAG: 50S ribosomal protein L3 [archaeon]